MITEDRFFKLEQVRNEAKISQADMALHLGISQSQVSRYEQDPENIPMGIGKKWHEFCGDMAGAKGVEIDDPRVELDSRIQLIQEYAANEPKSEGVFDKSIPVNDINIPVSADRFLSGVLITAKKPRIAVTGQFDAGKSRFINVFLGGNRLPTGYQPATSIICLMRHVNDKPDFQAEDVCFFNKGFNLDMADDKDHCLKHKMFAGGYESLCQYGTHSGSGKAQNVFAAVVYIDAPLLLGADFLDLPGYGNSSDEDGRNDDNERAEMANKIADVLVYASQATGFMNQNDLNCFVPLLRNLPVFKDENDNVDPLRNVFIVATHAHSVTQPGSLLAILDKAADRCYRHLDNAFADREQQGGVKVTRENFRNRFFTFSADDSALRSNLENDVKKLVVDDLLKSTLNKVNRHVLLAKAEATSSCDQWIRGLKIALDEREKAQAEITEIHNNEPDRLHKKQAFQKKINGFIDSSAHESSMLIAKVFSDHVNVVAIQSMITHRYKDDKDGKKEAQQLAASHLVDSIQKLINDGVRVKADILAEQIEIFLDGYGPSIDKSSSQSGSWDFNPRVAFMSAISGIGTIGALAAWASIAAAGSNLGGYILIGQIVGWLSSIGISLGGAGTVMAFVSSIGGPITLGIAAGVVMALTVFSLFGDSWQTKLAKKIHSTLVKQRAEKQMSEGVEKYWLDTKNAFEIAVSKTEEAYQSKLKSLYTLAFTTKKEAIEKELKFAEELRFFFAGMPWRTTPN